MGVLGQPVICFSTISPVPIPTTLPFDLSGVGIAQSISFAIPLASAIPLVIKGLGLAYPHQEWGVARSGFLIGSRVFSSSISFSTFLPFASPVKFKVQTKFVCLPLVPI